jgi:hypothetical protein
MLLASWDRRYYLKIEQCTKFCQPLYGLLVVFLGHPHYQHPARTAQHLSADLDNFSALVIYISFLAIAELPELWTEFHDENLIFTKKDFQAPGTSSLFAKLKKLRSVQQLVGVLEKACYQDPLDCPCLLDLVTPKSKLPAWMRNAPHVQIKTVTREAHALPGVPPRDRRQVVGPQPGVTTTTPSQVPVIGPQPVFPGSPPINSRQQAQSLHTRDKALVETLRSALNYAFINIWWAWIWFPFMRATFQSFGAAPVVAGLLSIGTFRITCLWLGHRRTMAVSQHQPASPSPSVITNVDRMSTGAKSFVVAIGLAFTLAYSVENKPITRSYQSRPIVRPRRRRFLCPRARLCQTTGESTRLHFSTPFLVRLRQSIPLPVRTQTCR